MNILKGDKHIFFTGIGGIGMSAIAQILLESGYTVSGSDRELSAVTESLAKRGAKIYKGHHANNLSDADMLVYSSAIGDDNPERVLAKHLNIPQLRRAEMLAEIMRSKVGIAIAGTHGKTTTSAMCAEIIMQSGLEPTIAIGGNLKSIQSNAHLGNGSLFITEADEYDRSFLTLSPVQIIITSIDTEHLDCYNDFEDILNTFDEFANKVPFYGKVICCIDDPGVKKILSSIQGIIKTYGMNPDALYSAKNISLEKMLSSFEVYEKDKRLGTIKLQVPGEHNIKNALAAVVLCIELDIPFDIIQSDLQAFQGVQRRFELLGTIKEVTIIDDYAHHPNEIKASLACAKSAWKKRLIAVFQPHLYTRTRDFYKEFAKELTQADIIFITNIYPARESPLDGVSSELILDEIHKLGHSSAFFVPDRKVLNGKILEVLEQNDLILTMGAGNIWETAHELVKILQKN